MRRKEFPQEVIDEMTRRYTEPKLVAEQKARIFEFAKKLPVRGTGSQPRALPGPAESWAAEQVGRHPRLDGQYR
jgi:hypothetical protein